MDHLRSMRIFLQVADLSSFSAAAKTLALPRASVSGAVHELESRLGVRLLHRTTRRVQLTQDGKVFSERARDLIHDLDELTSLFQSEPASLRGRIRVDMPLGAARDIVVPRLPEFIESHPEVEVELGSTDRIVDIVREGFDVVVRVGFLKDSSLMTRHVGYYPVVNCASAGYLEKHGTPTTVADLQNHRIVHYVSTLGNTPDGFDYVDESGEEQSVPMTGALTVNNSQAYLAACLAGLGIIQVPLIGVKEHLERGDLIEILPGSRPAASPVSLLYPHRRHQSRRVRVFMEWIVELLLPHVTQQRF